MCLRKCAENVVFPGTGNFDFRHVCMHQSHLNMHVCDLVQRFTYVNCLSIILTLCKSVILISEFFFFGHTCK